MPAATREKNTPGVRTDSVPAAYGQMAESVAVASANGIMNLGHAHRSAALHELKKIFSAGQVTYHHNDKGFCQKEKYACVVFEKMLQVVFELRWFANFRIHLIRIIHDP